MNPNDWPNDWKAILRAAHTEPIDPAHYTAVRARVLAEIERTRNPWRRLAWISGAAISAALLFTLVLRQPDVAPPPRIAIAIPPAPPAPIVRPRPVHVARAQARPPREPITIKLQTSDPNIVIYWIADY